MKILIDARMYGLEHAGIGRYVMNLVHELIGADQVNEYTILLKDETQRKFLISDSQFSMKISNFKFQIVDIPHYSLGEQAKLPRLLSRLDFDLAHFPHFNVPVFFRKPYIVTIHDLIKHTSRGMRTTTRSPFLYWAKYAGYKTVFGSAVKRAKKIIVPSEIVREDLIRNYNIQPQKIEVIYEGVDETFTSPITNHQSLITLRKYKIKKPYIIYTGSAYPHKNLERLIETFSRIVSNNIRIDSNRDSSDSRMNLVIVSSRNVFTERLRRFIEKTDSHKFVCLPGYVPDEDLAVLYNHATAFVFPSLAEGFGLPGIEAMAAGCPVICSDIPVFHEIYGDAAIYFRPTDVTDIADKIQLILADGKLRETMVIKGEERAKKFSWRKMAQETLRVYKDALDKS